MNIPTKVKLDSNGKSRILPNTKPYAMRLQEPPLPPHGGLPKFMKLRLEVGEKQIGFDNEEGILTLAGTELTALQWFELRYRIDQLFERAGRLERVRPASNPDTEGSSTFLSRNVRTILRLDRGYIQEIPASNGPYDEEHIAWMKERYSMVITKEQYGN